MRDSPRFDEDFLGPLTNLCGKETVELITITKEFISSENLSNKI